MANEAENEGSFPGAYSGQGRSWERKTREAIGLLLEKYGFQPKVVLSTRAPATITATAVAVPMCERQQLGSSYIGVKDSSGRGLCRERRSCRRWGVCAALEGNKRRNDRSSNSITCTIVHMNNLNSGTAPKSTKNEPTNPTKTIDANAHRS